MNFAIIGTNFISDSFAKAAGSIPDAKITAVLSRSADRGALFAAKYSIPKVYTELGQMLSDREIEAVYIASPNLCHSQQAIACLKAGRHVLCEKVIAHSHDAFLEMRRAAEESGCILLEAMRPDFDPAFDIIKSALPRLGKLRRAALEYCQYSSRYDSFLGGEVLNAFNPEMKNSALADIGIYPLHLCVRLFGEPKAAVSRSVRLHNGFQGMGIMLLDYGDMLASISYSKITESVNPSVIEGELGSLTVDRINAPKKITLKLRGEAEEILPYEPCDNNMVYEISAFMDMVRGNASPKEYLDASEICTRLVDGALI